MEEFVAASAEPGPARASEALHRSFALRDIADLVLGRYRRLRLATSTHLLTGEQDFVLPPAVLSGGERNAPLLRTESVPGVGHYLHEECPELIAAAALRLFESVEA